MPGERRHRTDWGPDQGQGVPASHPVLLESVAPNYFSVPLLQEWGSPGKIGEAPLHQIFRQKINASSFSKHDRPTQV